MFSPNVGCRLQVAKSRCREIRKMFYFLQQNLYKICCAFYRPNANLFCNKWRKFCIQRDTHVILTNQKSVFAQLATTWFVARQVGTRGVGVGGDNEVPSLFCSRSLLRAPLYYLDLSVMRDNPNCYLGNRNHPQVTFLALGKRVGEKPGSEVGGLYDWVLYRGWYQNCVQTDATTTKIVGRS